MYIMQIENLDSYRGSGTARSWFFTLFHVAFGLIAFSTSVEGSVIEIKSATLAPQDTTISRKA